VKRVWWVAFGLMAVFAMAPPPSLAQVGRQAASSAQTDQSQIVLLGFVQEGRTKTAILGWEGLVFLAREGDTILGTYRVERLGEDFAILRDGATEIRASYRNGPVQPARLPPSPAAGVTEPGLPIPFGMSQGLMPSGPAGPAEASGTGSSGSAVFPPAPSLGATSPEPTAPQTDEENPFTRAAREQGQEGSAPVPPQDNPFLRALRDKASALAPPQEDPSQQATPQDPAPAAQPGSDNPFLRSLRRLGTP